MGIRFPPDLRHLSRLKLVHLISAGFDKLDFDSLPDGCVACNVYEHEMGISEFVLAAMLEWTTGLSRMDRLLKKGDWGLGFWGGGPVHGELAGKTVGIVGHGRIGRAVAVRARAFGCRVIAATRSPAKGDDNLDRIAGMEGLDGLLGEADFVVVCCPLDDGTRDLIGRRQFERMKDTAVLINVARGPVVHEESLFEACRDGAIGGAVIDVWYQYPETVGAHCWPSRFPFQELDNVFMTPHASGWSEGLLDRRMAAIAGNLDRLASSRPLSNVVRVVGVPAKDSPA